MQRLWTATWLVVAVSLSASGTTYYVSSSVGNDGNAGTTQAAPWKTLAKVNSMSFAPGDKVLFRRGDTWRESLVPPSSGDSSNSIYFDAYGSGPAPALSAYQDLPSAAWSSVSGNLWRASLAAVAVNNVLFGTIWGQKQTSQAAVQRDRDFYFAGGFLYVYSTANPATYYPSVGAITTGAGQLIYVNGKGWLQFQHLALNWFDGFGVNVAGASDHLLFANMEANGRVPSGTLPHGFYVNASSPTDIKFYNDEAHLNYDGFRFDGTATAITLVNCKGYANRDGGLVDNTGHATYSYSHFYANNIAILNSQDVQGSATDGGHNLPTDTLPQVRNFATYPARITFTVDDVGFADRTDTYIDSLLPVFDARGLKLSAAVVAAYSSALVSKIQSWLSAGEDINSHSWSHQYYTNSTAFTISYKGSGSAATLSISANHLSTTVTGSSGLDNLNLDLSDPSYNTVAELIAAINGNSSYIATIDGNCRTAAHSTGLSDVSSQDIKSSAYTVLFQKDRLETDELRASRNWLQTNISGLPDVKVFVYPSGIEDSQTQAWAVAEGYKGARGGLSIGLGSNAIYSKGINVQDITSLGLSGLHGMSPQQIDSKIGALLFKASVWGVPYGLFDHVDDLTADEVATILDSLLAHGAVLMTNTQLVDWLAATSNVSGTTTYVSPAPGAPADLQVSAASPAIHSGANLGASYATDISGIARPALGPWDLGAYTHAVTTYGAAGPGSFRIGGTPSLVGPTTYRARTDNCETGTESGCKANGGTGDPMHFLGRSSDAAYIPAMTGMNSVAIDPDFHSRILQATDSTVSSGSMSGPSGGDVGWWAADSSAFIATNTGSVRYLLYLDTTNFRVTKSNLRTAASGHGDQYNFAHGADLIFSSTATATTITMFELDGTLINRLVIDKNPISPTFDQIISRTQIVDLARGGGCLPIGYTPSWNGTFDVSADDTSFTLAYSNAGAQGTGTDVVNYTIGKGCRHYVTGSATGASISGDWGCSYPVGGGMTSCSGPANAAAIVSDSPDICGSVIPCAIGDQYQLHGVDQTPNPKYAHISKNASTNCINGAACSCGSDGACSTYFWEVGTNVVRPCGDPVHGSLCGGHQTKGYLYEYRGSGSYKTLDYSNPVVGGRVNPGTVIISNMPSDDHGSGNGANASWSAPIFLAMTDIPMVTTGYPAAYYGELIGASTDVPGTVWRFAHNYNSGAEQYFNPQSAIGVVSPDGRYMFFTSDWLGTLGSINGAPTCNKATAQLGKRLNSTPYTTGQTFLNVGAGSSIEKVMICGTSGSAAPTWNKGTQIPQSIVSAIESGTTVTITAAGAHNLAVGDPVWIEGVSVAGYNSTTAAFTVTAVPSSTTYQFTATASGLASGNGGNSYAATVDGTVVWAFVGLNDCAAQVFIVDLLSAH